MHGKVTVVAVLPSPTTTVVFPPDQVGYRLRSVSMAPNRVMVKSPSTVPE